MFLLQRQRNNNFRVNILFLWKWKKQTMREKKKCEAVRLYAAHVQQRHFQHNHRQLSNDNWHKSLTLEIINRSDRHQPDSFSAFPPGLRWNVHLTSLLILSLSNIVSLARKWPSIRWWGHSQIINNFQFMSHTDICVGVPKLNVAQITTYDILSPYGWINNESFHNWQLSEWNILHLRKESFHNYI